MFLPISFHSINCEHGLVIAALAGRSLTYVTEDGRFRYQLYEYRRLDGGELVARDLIASDLASGEVFVHDYLLLPNGMWRSAFGEVARDFVTLLPPELLPARLVESEDVSLLDEDELCLKV